LAATNQFQSSKANIEEADMLAIILDVAPAEHQNMLTSEQRAKADSLKLSDLEEAMGHVWKRPWVNKQKPIRAHSKCSHLL
jgi:hypothetical protein